MTIPKLLKHQVASVKFLSKNPRVFDTSDAGTGKTPVHITDFANHRRKGGGCALILCPKSLIHCAWGKDFKTFAPDIKVSLAYAENRLESFQEKADAYVTNIDAAVWLAKQPAKFFASFDTLIIDECFPAGTLVDTPKGKTPIEMLITGDLVYTSNGALHVTRTFAKETINLVELEFENGTTFTCTPNHPIATTTGWVEAGATRGLLAMRLDIRKLHKQRSNFLWEKLRTKSDICFQDTGRTKTDKRKDKSKLNGAYNMEQGDSLSPRNKIKAKHRSQSFWASAQTAWRKWIHSTLRTDDARDAPEILGTKLPHTNWKEKGKRLRNCIQSRLCIITEKMGVRSRWVFTHIAKKLGCEARYLACPTRVVRVSSVECPSSRMVYNIQVDGPHNYSVAGQLVHNCTSIKHGTSGRSRAVAKIRKYFNRRRLLTGTPISNGICDIHHQMYILDDGIKLGQSFFAFRNACCTPTQVGHNVRAVQWADKPGIEAVVGALIQDVVIRNRFVDCVDIPPNHQYAVSFQMNPKHHKTYTQLERDSSLVLKSLKSITAVNGAVLYNKLLQCASGASYTDDDSYTVFDQERNTLIGTLIEARKHSIVFFSWKHQRDELVAMAKKEKWSYAVIDGGTTKKGERERIVDAYQAGNYKVLFAHPQSAGHGLTLTKGTTTIFASPTPNLEHFLQAYKRIYRISQTEKTETIMVIAENTIDERVWASCQAKNLKQSELLTYLGE